jgi:Flp pilus assembly protein TadD
MGLLFRSRFSTFSKSLYSVSSNWQKHVLASSGYLELGMLEDAALALEEIEPADKMRDEVRGARLNLYMAAKNWEMAAAVAGRMAKVEPENACWWINLAYSIRRTESIEEAEAILLRARELHPKSAIIAFNLACYACVGGRIEEAKLRLLHAINLDKDVRKLAIDDEDLQTLHDWIAGLG